MSLSADVSATLQPGFTGVEVPDWLREAHADGLLSVALYGVNATPDDGLGPVCAGVRAALPGVLLAVDEEGGDVTRVHYPRGSSAVGNAVLGRLDDPSLTEAGGAAIARELVALGIGLDLAPVVDVNSCDDNPVIGVRSFGADAGLAARHGAAFVRGLQAGGVAGCAKHFPGHGDTVHDSHLGLPRVEAPVDVLRARELVPFAAAVEAGVACVMTSHVLVPAVDPARPATFSSEVLALLRDELGFDGVVVSDALDMAGASAVTGVPEAAVRALAAGVDLLCLGSETGAERYRSVHAAVVEAVRSGRLPRGRVAEAARRVRALAGRWAVDPDGSGTGPAGADDAGEPLPADRVADAFALGDAVPDFLADPAPLAVVQVGSGANVAVGGVAWGPASVAPTTSLEDVPRGAKVAVVGRAVGPEHPARAVAARLGADGHRVLLVECGWPRGPVDVVTYGGSPAVARALLDLLHDGKGG